MERDANQTITEKHHQQEEVGQGQHLTRFPENRYCESHAERKLTCGPHGHQKLNTHCREINLVGHGFRKKEERYARNQFHESKQC